MRAFSLPRGSRDRTRLLFSACFQASSTPVENLACSAGFSVPQARLESLERQDAWGAGSPVRLSAHGLEALNCSDRVDGPGFQPGPSWIALMGGGPERSLLRGLEAGDREG